MIKYLTAESKHTWKGKFKHVTSQLMQHSPIFGQCLWKTKKMKDVTERKSAKANCPIAANVGVWYFGSYMILPIAAIFPMPPKNAIVKITQVKIISKVVSPYTRWKVSLFEEELLSNSLSSMFSVAVRCWKTFFFNKKINHIS